MDPKMVETSGSCFGPGSTGAKNRDVPMGYNTNLSWKLLSRRCSHWFLSGNLLHSELENPHFHIFPQVNPRTKWAMASIAFCMFTRPGIWREYKAVAFLENKQWVSINLHGGWSCHGMKGFITRPLVASPWRTRKKSRWIDEIICTNRVRWNHDNPWTLWNFQDPKISIYLDPPVVPIEMCTLPIGSMVLVYMLT